MKIIGFAGYSGSGKTTLIEQLIPRFTGKGLRVSLIKHAHHTFEIDKPGKDSFRHREAGASEVMLVSSGRQALVRELRDEAEPSLDEQLAHVALRSDAGRRLQDLAIPKIEVYRPALGKPRLPRETPNIVALACDAGGDAQDCAAVPQLDLNNCDDIAGFILDHLGLEQCQCLPRPPTFYVPHWGERPSG